MPKVIDQFRGEAAAMLKKQAAGQAWGEDEDVRDRWSPLK
jgi:hypothetical protein